MTARRSSADVRGSDEILDTFLAATTRDGQNHDNDYAEVFVVRDGKIAAVREYFDTAYAQRVLFADERR